MKGEILLAFTPRLLMDFILVFGVYVGFFLLIVLVILAILALIKYLKK